MRLIKMLRSTSSNLLRSNSLTSSPAFITSFTSPTLAAAPFKTNSYSPLVALRNYRSTIRSPRCSVSDSDSAQVREMITAGDIEDPRLEKIASAIRVIPDFKARDYVPRYYYLTSGYPGFQRYH